MNVTMFDASSIPTSSVTYWPKILEELLHADALK